MNNNKDIPVYLFTGFLGAGKTTFIQDILTSKEFNEGENTLLLLCEEGEVEYEPDKFAFPNVMVAAIDDEKDLTKANLAHLAKECDAERVMVEYNGMWMLESFFRNMPPEWIIYQEVTFADATTFLMYNQNMRQLTFDKMKTAEMDIFNRCVHGFDKMAFHKEVRIANRKAQIIYEYGPDDVEPDDIVDPLPFDLDADEIEIKDEDYAEWYRDINENPNRYDGKTLILKVRAAMVNEMPRGEFAAGRHVMTCCVEDIQFAALVYKWQHDNDLHVGEWIKVKGTVKMENHEAYEGVGPVVRCVRVEKCEAPEPEVATF